MATTMEWQKIETAPKDGSLILLLSKAYVDDFGISNELPIHFPPRAALGKWWAEGDSWVDEYGNLSDDGKCYHLEITGVWESGGGWFQPNEVTHWCPIPPLPEK